MLNGDKNTIQIYNRLVFSPSPSSFHLNKAQLYEIGWEELNFLFC